MFSRMFKSDVGVVCDRNADFKRRLVAKLQSYLHVFEKENPSLKDKLYRRTHRTGEMRARVLLTYLEGSEFFGFTLNGRYTVLTREELQALKGKALLDAVDMTELHAWDPRVMEQQHPMIKNKNVFVEIELKPGFDVAMPRQKAINFISSLRDDALVTRQLSNDRGLNEDGEEVLSEVEKHLLRDIFYEVYDRQAALGNSTVLRRYIEAALLEQLGVDADDVKSAEDLEVERTSASFSGTVPIDDWVGRAKHRARRNLLLASLRQVGAFSKLPSPALEQDAIPMQQIRRPV